ncbi:MAG TPA: hypothetical protein VFZ01_19510 [Geminicoccaceae bacterium]
MPLVVALLLILALGVGLPMPPAGAEQPRAEEDEERLTLLVPAGAGGGTDAVARRLALLLNEPLGVPVDVLNRPGGGGAEAMEALRGASPDGLTLGILTATALRVAGPGGFAPLLLFNLDAPALHLPAGLGAEAQVDAIIDGAIAASGGPAGSLPHLALAHLAAARGGRLPPSSWQPAADGTAALQALAAGRVGAVVATSDEADGLRRAGAVQTIGGEAAGLPRTLGGWRGLVAPAGLPRRRSEAIVAAARAAVASEAFQDFLEIRGYAPADLGPAAFASFLETFSQELERAARGLD